MKIYFYLSLTPESFIASMLPPMDFGSYLAVGTQKRASGQVIFFEIEEPTNDSSFNLDNIKSRCINHSNGEPKHSVYGSCYRVLEKIPLSDIKDLYLVTRDGKPLCLQQSEILPEVSQNYYLYQEICPVHPSVVSTLNPLEFSKYLTDGSQNIYFPKICFVDLHLGELREDPKFGEVRNLPYQNVEHLRDCLIQLKNNPKKSTTTVDRISSQSFPFRTIENGIFLGSKENLLFYPFPSKKDLQGKYYDWWRSASM